MVMDKYSFTDVEEICKVLVGRRIVEARMVSGSDLIELSREAYDRINNIDNVGVLTLDNGIQLFIEGNAGCGGCSSGWYDVSKVATTNNAIMGVRVEYTDKDGYETMYRLFVFSENEEVNAAVVEGSDGNGYYGTGFYVYVLPMTIDGSVVDKNVPAIEWKSVE